MAKKLNPDHLYTQAAYIKAKKMPLNNASRVKIHSMVHMRKLDAVKINGAMLIYDETLKP